jgi:uncharacterized protein (TIGR03437 family)
MAVGRAASGECRFNLETALVECDRMKTRRPFHLPLFLLLCAAGAYGQNQCRFHLASQSDGATSGVTLSLVAAPDSNGNCQLGSASLELAVGNGVSLHRIAGTVSWQTGIVYTAKAAIMAAGPQQLSLNGQSLGTIATAFQPTPGTLFGSLAADTGPVTEEYVATQISLAVSNGSNNISLAPDGNTPIPLPLTLMSGADPWPAALTVDPTQTLTITATFVFAAAVSNPHLFDPYIDAYGQTMFTTWPGKVATDSDLQAAITEEQTWLANNGPIGGLDMYGGSLLAGWTDRATGYYHTAFHNNRYWLISPLGNPLFYLGIDTAKVRDSTPIAGRESMFANLPPMTGTFAAAYTQNLQAGSQNITYFSPAIANMIRKYGSGWQNTQANLIPQQLASWVFAGSGKWTQVQPALVVNPVLAHAAVANAVPGGHPDVWDPSILSQLKATLTSQIGSDATNPYVLGWSVGNEADEVIAAQEITGILALGAASPAKKNLADYAIQTLYGGSVAKLAASWKITASTAADVYAATTAQPPANDVEAMRQFYEGAWYSTLHQTVQAIDSHHLYLGSWTQPKEHQTEWSIMAANCDVVGFDFYNQTFLDPDVQALIQSTKKPVLVGEFSYPADYGGTRGFSALMKDFTLTDSQSGDMYAQWLRDAGANPYVVGVEWFEYVDQPVTGNANDGDPTPASLVIGKNQAFGMLDIANRPKYDLVNKVRAANIATLQNLGLLGSAPVLSSAPQNGATYLTGGLVPGSWAQVKGSGLSDGTRIWQQSDFAGLGNRLPTDLSGVQALVNGTAAAVYYISPTQVSFQVPAGISGTANVQVTRDGLVSAMTSAPAVSSAPGIFPIALNGTNYAAAVFPDGKTAADPSNGPAFRNARPGDAVSLFATGLAPAPSGTTVTVTPLSGVTVTIGSVTVNADFAALVAVGEFQINFTVPQQFANMPAANYPITVSVNGVSSPSTIDTAPPGPVVLPVHP